jgi:Carboxypeptidase regulatory-like domain/TonB dependent receptor
MGKGAVRDNGMVRLLYVIALMAALSAVGAFGQSINSGTVSGQVTDPSGALIAGAKVRLTNPVTGFEQMTVTDTSGNFKFNSVPVNNYRLEVSAAGFNGAQQTVDVRNSVPVVANIALNIATEASTVTVQATAAAVETDTTSHQDVDSSAFSKLPVFSPGAGLSDAITYSTGAVAADANGFFHPLGDHAQTTFVIDGQPVSDQQSKLFSTQIPLNALQGMELITGSPDAQYGDKTSLVVNATTRSGLGATKPFGSFDSSWGSFGTYSGSATLGFGTPTLGNFLALNVSRSGRFLDTPEFLPIHDIGNNGSIFDRIDWQPGPQDVFHLDLFTARNWFQVPNSYDQLMQDQKQRVMSWSIAPGYQHTFNAHTLLTVNPFVRRDQLDYYPSRDPFDDTPVTASQNRVLMNYGVKADLSFTHGHHDIKIGTQIQQTRLLENFQFAITNPTYNPVCLDSAGDPLLLPSVTNPADCSAANPSYVPNPNLLPGIVPYDLTRGGAPFNFHATHNINEYAFYVMDTITLGHLTINAGLRDDQYNGLTSSNGVQPRLGLSYLLPTNTVLRASYARTFETPFNENLLLSSAAGTGGLAENVFGSVSTPIRPGNRNDFDAGLQQGIGKWLIIDADYFWKYTHNAYDFSVLFNTPITFPISWNNSKVDGVSGRVSTINLHGFQAYMTLGHTRARYFPPEAGGLVALGGIPSGVFRIDHDQAYQQNANFRYQRHKNQEWIDFTWRYDSGLVVSGVPDVAAALMLTPSEQVDIGLACGGVPATLSAPLRTCSGMGTSTLLTLPQTGTENDDHNPDRVKPHNLFDIGIGTDNLFHKESGPRWTLRFTVENASNKVALYNFLSTFSGTHFIEPRSYQATAGYVF